MILFANSGPNSKYPTDYGITWGTSESAPEVAGICGLMRSINYDLTADGSSLTSTQIQAGTIQLNANNIITFTADKLPDFDNIGNFTYPSGQIIPKSFPPSGDLEYTNSKVTVGAGIGYTSMTGTANYIYDWSGMPSWFDPEAAGSGNWQYAYKLQANDPVQRSWAQRVGFGRVNAYRAVANTIPDRALMVYTGSSASLDYSAATQNENTQYLLHMGAYRPANGYRQSEDNYSGTETNANTTTTLTAGGVIMPNQSLTYENEGETFLYSQSGTPVSLTVGDRLPGGTDKDILAIDGNLIGDDLANNKITSNADGKVLVTGYMRDVEITGDTTKVDDEIIDGTTNDGYSKIEVDAGDIAEIYGVVQLQNYGNFVVNGGNLTIQPGGELDMNGNNDFEIQSGHVTMQASSKISSAARQVFVDNGATLEIAGYMPVQILCNVHVRSGGTLVIDGITPGAPSGSTLQLNQFYVDEGGTITCQPGGRLVLNIQNDQEDQPLTNYCYGDFNFAGTTAQGGRVTLTAGVSTCGIVNQFAQIYCASNYPNIGNARFTFQNGDDSDVFINVVDDPKDEILNDNFSAGQFACYCDPIHQWLLYLGGMGAGNYLIANASVTNCNFFVENPPSWSMFVGLDVGGLSTLHVTGSTFMNLFEGIETWGVTRAYYGSDIAGNPVPNTFGNASSPLQIGIHDLFTAAYYCSNQFQNCNLGIAATSDIWGAEFNNTFTSCTNTGFFAGSSGNYALRANTFTNCSLYGIYSWGFGNNVILRDANGWQYGRNQLTAPIWSAGSPPSADMARANQGGLTVSCGRNRFILSSTPPGSPSYHIINFDAMPYPIDVESNSWEPGFTVYQVNCLISGAPLNDWATAPLYCGNRLDDNPAPMCSKPSCCSPVYDPYPATADWFGMDPASPELSAACTNACAMLLSDTIDSVTRSWKARDALWAASLTDSSATYLPIVNNAYAQLIADPLAAPELKSTVWMLKGNLQEKLGQPDSALACYNTVYQNYHQYNDSVFALWSIERLSIADTQTSSADSARGALIQQEYTDILAMIDTLVDTGGAQKRSTGGLIPADSGLDVTVHPNPAGNYTRICVADLPADVPAVVEVVNENGDVVATLYNATPDAECGLCLTLDCSKLASGTYYARIVNDIMGRAVKISVQH